MDPILMSMAKAWLVETLKKAAASGGATAFDELLASIPEDSFLALRAAVERIAARRRITVTVKSVSSP
jgi:hypothetical protein